MALTEGSSRGGLCLDLLGGLAASSVAVLLLSGDILNVSASASAGRVSSQSLGRPIVSSLLSMEAATGLSVLSVLLMEVRPTGEPTDHMRVRMLLTSRRSTPSLYNRTIIVSKWTFVSLVAPTAF